MTEAGEVRALRAELAEALKLVAKAENAYAGSEICRMVIGFMEAAGCGRPGTPNTIWAMTKELIARTQAAEFSRDQMGAALREVVRECETSDWKCESCGHDFGMTETDLYYFASTALSGINAKDTSDPAANAPVVDAAPDGGCRCCYYGQPEDAATARLALASGIAEQHSGPGDRAEREWDGT